DAAFAFKRAGRPGWTALADYARAEAALARGADHDAEAAIEEAFEATGGRSGVPLPVLLMRSLFLAGHGKRDAASAVLTDYWPQDLPPPGRREVKAWLDSLPGKIGHGERWLDEVIGPLSRGN
ncbi:MAG: hypothetical protein ACLFV8_14850, partial [Alphaproteobacteria bacterium]